MADQTIKKFQRIVIHCSDSEFGTALMIDEWHKAPPRNWSKIGYHEVLTNGYPNNSWHKLQKKIAYLEGAAEIGRQVNTDEFCQNDEIGAHAAAYNSTSYGICMIGVKTFSDKLLNATLDITRFRLNQFGLIPDNKTVVGHCELDSAKTCPNIDMNIFRKHLIENTYYGESIKVIHENPKGIKQKIIDIFKHFYKGTSI